MFDSADELLRKIRLGEDSTLELKAVFTSGDRIVGPKREDLADEIAAIANTRDGVVVLGIDDKTREVVGIPVERLDAVERFVYEVCNDGIKPPLAFQTIRMTLPDSGGVERAILKIDVPRSLFVHRSPGGYFQRRGSSKREMEPEALGRLFQQRSQARLIRFEEQVVPMTARETLEPELYERFLGESGEQATLTLRKLKLLADDDAGVPRATVAGVLLCSSDSTRYLPSSYIQAVRYRGTERDANYQIDAKDLKGPIDRQVQLAMAFVLANMRVSARKTPAREEFPQFSERAVFEALVNAVAHRDYSIHGSKIRLFLFDDRLELYSPGALANTVTVDSLALRQSTRNELLASLLARVPVDATPGGGGRKYLMEKRGEGVPTILRESLALSGRCPEYRLIDDDELLLTIFGAEPPDHGDAGV